MPVFECEKCGCVENTALCNYWVRKSGYDFDTGGKAEVLPALCSECDPDIGKWHGKFAQVSAVGLAIGEDGFLYSHVAKVTHTKIVGRVGAKL